MNALIQHPRAMLPMPAVARILSRFDRRQLEGFIAVAIDIADALDGDPEAEGASWTEDMRAEASLHLPDDCEANGDEEDDDPQGQCDEDGINTAYGDLKYRAGAGCAISDPGGDTFDDREEGELFLPSYGVDQSKVLPCPLGRDVVVDFECGDAVKGATAGLLPRRR